MEFREETNISEEDDYRKISNPFEGQRFSSSGKKSNSPDKREYLNPINFKSVSCSQGDDISQIDPLTFSEKGEFIKQLCKKFGSFLGNNPEENLFLTVRLYQLI